MFVDNKDYKVIIGERLREFGLQKFGKIKIFAEQLGIEPSSLQSTYLKGRSVPGSPMLIKLLKMGCDLNWLLNVDTEGNSFILRENSEYYALQSEKNKIIEDLERENSKLKAALEKFKIIFDNLDLDS